MYIVPSWGDLPQLVLTNIYSLLNKNDRISASSVCCHWRSALFQPKFFEKVTFQVCRQKAAKNEFYLESVALFCNSLAICFNPHTLFGAQQTAEILQRIKANNCAQRLILRPKYPSVLLLQYRNFLQLIEMFLNNRKCALRELDLGGMESLTEHSAKLLKAINGAEHVQSLGLATVKSQPNYYLVRPISPVAFEQFHNLQKLSMDYDHMTDEWLEMFGSLRFFRELILHVHGSEDFSQPIMSAGGWARLTAKNPFLRLGLVLIYSYDAAYELHHILSHEMPLSHLKVLFCEHINTAALDYLSNYMNTLKSVVWVDAVTEILDYFEDYEQDPLVMMAWRCKELKELVLNGYEVDPVNVIGIARLRGANLKRLEVSDVAWTPQLCDEISKQLGRDWTPLPKTRLNSIFVNDDGRVNLQLQNEYVMKCVQETFESV